MALVAGAHQVLTGRAGVRGASAVTRRADVGERNVDSELRFYAAWSAVAGVLMHKAAADPVADRLVAGPIAAGWATAGASRLLSLRAVGRPDPVFLALAALELGLAGVLGQTRRSGSRPT